MIFISIKPQCNTLNGGFIYAVNQHSVHIPTPVSDKTLLKHRLGKKDVEKIKLTFSKTNTATISPMTGWALLKLVPGFCKYVSEH